MIYIDSTELRVNSRLGRHINEICTMFGGRGGSAQFAKSVSRTNLEALTGADVMISPLSLPITGAMLVSKHIQAGAVLIQLKFGRDLTSSIGNRMKDALDRMIKTGARPSQCVLMFVGTLSCGKDDFAAINGSSTKRPRRRYSGVMRAIWRWIRRGGVYYPVPTEKTLPTILKMINDDMDRNGTVERFWPQKVEDGFTDDPLEKLQKIEDWRIVIASIPDIGPKRATSLMESMERRGAVQNLAQALSWTSAPKEVRDQWGVPKMRLWGPESFKRVHQMMFGDDDDDMFYFDIQVVQKG